VTKFLVTDHGGPGMPTDPAQAEQMKAAFGQWLAQAGGALVDPGAPLRPGTEVASGSPRPRVAVGGHSVVETASMDDAVAILRRHPFVARGGTLHVDEALAV
jgi:hypothetical protein